MNNLSLSSKQDLLLFVEREKFRKIFVLSGKKSFRKSGAQNILNPILKKKVTHIYFKLLGRGRTSNPAFVFLQRSQKRLTNPGTNSKAHDKRVL